MAIEVKIDHAVFDGDTSSAELMSLALSYFDNVDLKRSRVFLSRNGDNRFKGEETSNFLGQLALDRQAFLEKLRSELTLPAPTSVRKTRDVNGLVTSVVEYY